MERMPTLKQINRQLAPFARPNHKKSLREMAFTLIPYLTIWAVSVLLLKNGFSPILLLPLEILGGLFMVRTFIIFHDTCHGSFFKSKGLNRWVGRLTGLLTFTPFAEWRQAHNLHHASSGDLDRRGVGDVWTMTASEYRNASTAKRWAYRLYRNPLVMFGLGPFFMLLVSNRLPGKNSKRPAKIGVWLTNLSLLFFIIAIGFVIGFKTYFLIQIPILFFGGLAGIWLFYIQHQFEETYWSKSEHWDVIQAAVKGSSYYQLPAVLHWFSGNIGYHHIHHLRSGIPFYNLPACHNELALFRSVRPLTIKESFKTVKLRLWDESQNKMIGFGDLQTV